MKRADNMRRDFIASSDLTQRPQWATHAVAYKITTGAVAQFLPVVMLRALRRAIADCGHSEIYAGGLAMHARLLVAEPKHSTDPANTEQFTSSA